MDFFMAPHLILGMPERPREEKTKQRIDLADIGRSSAAPLQNRSYVECASYHAAMAPA
jgi:hypothetical protein